MLSSKRRRVITAGTDGYLQDSYLQLPSVLNQTTNTAPLSDFGENWSSVSERTETNPVAGGGQSLNDCLSASKDLSNSHHYTNISPLQLPEPRSCYQVLGVHSNLELHNIWDIPNWSSHARHPEFDALGYQNEQGKYPNGKMLLNERLQNLINEPSEYSINSPTYKDDGDEILSSASDGIKIQSKTISGSSDWKHEEVKCPVPEIGREFTSEEDALIFYEKYAKELGFKVRKGKVERLSDGTIKKRLFLCSKEGFRSKKQLDKKTKYARKETRTGCNARIKLTAQNGKWVISDLHLHHNHAPEAQHQVESVRLLEPASGDIQNVGTDKSTEFGRVDCNNILDELCFLQELQEQSFDLQEKEKEDDFSVNLTSKKLKIDSNSPRSLRSSEDNDKEVNFKVINCQTHSNDTENFPALNQEISFEQASSRRKALSSAEMEDIASSRKEFQGSSMDMDNEAIDSFYASLDCESRPADPNNNGSNTVARVEIKQALELVRSLFKGQLSALLHSDRLLTLKSALNLLSSVPKEGNISISLKSVILQLAKDIPSMVQQYNGTNMAIDQANHVKASKDASDSELTQNKKRYRGLSNSRHALTCEIALAEQKVVKLEQQLSELKAEVEKQKDVKNEITRKIQFTYTEAIGLKSKADKLSKEASALEKEKACAEKTRLELEGQWERFGKLLEENFLPNNY